LSLLQPWVVSLLPHTMALTARRVPDPDIRFGGTRGQPPRTLMTPVAASGAREFRSIVRSAHSTDDRNGYGQNSDVRPAVRTAALARC
jgi:hypothetical protein